MINISKIDRELLSRLSGAYLHAGFVFGVEPIEASEKKQHKVRKWISNQYIELIHNLPEEITVFSMENNDKEVLSFLKDCCAEVKRLEKRKMDKFEEDFAVFDEESKATLKHLLNLEIWPDIKSVDNGIQIIVDDTPAYRRKLLLRNADSIPNEKQGYYCHNLDLVCKKEENKYCLHGELEEPIEETLEPFALTFSDVEVTVEVYNSCDNMTFWENPWDFLRTISFSIGMKADLPGDYCNNAEKGLLPLIKEIVALEYWMELPEQEYFSFNQLKTLANQYGYEKVKLLFAKLETIKPGDSDFYTTVKKLIFLLCEQKCEPMWREIYEKIKESQAEYPNKVESLHCNKLLVEVRADIQKLLESHGYIGAYPDFVKDGALKGVHLEQSYNMTYFVGMEKRVQYHIHCYESFEENDYLTIQFLCGTALLKKGEETEDVYGCLFNAKGRRLFHTVHHYIPLQNCENAEQDDLKTSVNIAVKKAECTKLNKKEQKEYYGKMVPGWGTFWWIFFVAGGIFGITMTLISMIMCILATIAFGLFSDIPEMLSIMPWGLLLVIGWIGFGGAMGIVEVLARRK